MCKSQQRVSCPAERFTAFLRSLSPFSFNALRFIARTSPYKIRLSSFHSLSFTKSETFSSRIINSQTRSRRLGGGDNGFQNFERASELHCVRARILQFCLQFLCFRKHGELAYNILQYSLGIPLQRSYAVLHITASDLKTLIPSAPSPVPRRFLARIINLKCKFRQRNRRGDAGFRKFERKSERNVPVARSRFNSFVSSSKKLAYPRVSRREHCSGRRAGRRHPTRDFFARLMESRD